MSMKVPDAGSRLVLTDGVLVEAAGDLAPGTLVVAGKASGPARAGEDELVGGLDRKIAALSDGLTGTIRTFCESVQDSVANLSCAEVTVEFGVAIKAGVEIPYLATGAGEATVKVTAKWTKQS
jgi:Trypsin-co-occurring domain 1